MISSQAEAKKYPAEQASPVTYAFIGFTPRALYMISDSSFTPVIAPPGVSKSNIIDAYYSLYLFNKNTNIEQKYNFLNENMFPLSFSGESTYITVDEWNAKFRFTYDCLMKVIIEKLNLYKLNEK